MRLLVLIFVIIPTVLFAQKDVKEWKEGNLSVTKHQLKIGNDIFNYTATTGYMPIKDEKDTMKANLFFIAYTKDGDLDPAKRPILFSFNGGPGSSSVWLHMGALGPKVVLMKEDGNTLPPPYKYVDNPDTWLDKADIVFIDPMMTGFTRPSGKSSQNEFTGFDNDIQFVGDFIRLYLSRYKRWSSPKFIAGESYGTTRAAGLSGYLQERYGLYVNGLILISAILDFGTVRTERGNDVPFPFGLPTFAATSWYHKKLDPRYSNLNSLLQEVQQFATTDYASALIKGDKISEAERNTIINKLHDYTGLSKDYIDQTNLRLYVGQYNKELLRKEGKTVGRLDTRIIGQDYNNAGASYDYDPSNDIAIYGAYAAAINDYIRRDLKYENDIPYEILTGRVRPWTNSQDKYLNVAETLRGAMVKNNYLKVWICNGYYDMATPYFATDYVIHHMFLPKNLQKNISFTYYEAGHMMYIHKQSLIKMRKDYNQFMNDVLSEIQ
ncbi:MAG: peptidase S10 [Chitinophagaceae bacterium]|nr:peptidase S10 [Chitinophagaceae bacterium]MBL0131790.1 peptidase S10 [Chitinophagaceae bacterium]MBL0272138.1 peptidase S10 [Chitinophagaceae bacterium]